jgi:hypothetical protein
VPRDGGGGGAETTVDALDEGGTMAGMELEALNSDDPTGPKIKVRLPDEIVSIVCHDCDRVVGGGDPAYARFSYSLSHPCPFCGKGPPVIE